MSVKNEIVIARYSENLDWVGSIPDGFTVKIYNKGAEITSQAALRRADEVVKLANNGRESDTILRHIIGKKDFTGGFTVFLQGDPFEHSPDIIALLKAHDAWEDLQPLSWRWLSSKGLPPADILAREDGCFVGGSRVRSEIFSLMTWSPVQFADPGNERISNEYRKLHDLPNGVNIAGHFFRRCEWPELAERAEQHFVGRFSYGALFAVRQEQLAQLPHRSLELALRAANGHSMYGYVLERLWLHMCGEPFILAAPKAAQFPESLERLPSRFVPVQRYVKQPLHRRVIPAAKRRIATWAQT